jgi:ribulose 1,5-bisphosphate carboxylase large subunit-like protein
MKMLRNEKENLRQQETRKIRDRKDAAIAELIQKVAQKYDEIKNYYQEITNTNLEMISELKKELHKEKVDDAIQ